MVSVPQTPAADALATYGPIAVSLVVCVVTVLITARNLNRRLWISSFLAFTARYNSLRGALPPEASARKAYLANELDDLDSADRDRAETALRAYFNLLSEEYYLFVEHGLHPPTWRHWRTELAGFTKNPLIRDAWRYFRSDFHLEGFRRTMDEHCGLPSRDTAASS